MEFTADCDSSGYAEVRIYTGHEEKIDVFGNNTVQVPDTCVENAGDDASLLEDDFAGRCYYRVRIACGCESSVPSESPSKSPSKVPDTSESEEDDKNWEACVWGNPAKDDEILHNVQLTTRAECPQNTHFLCVGEDYLDAEGRTPDGGYLFLDDVQTNLELGSGKKLNCLPSDADPERIVRISMTHSRLTMTDTPIPTKDLHILMFPSCFNPLLEYTDKSQDCGNVRV